MFGLTFYFFVSLKDNVAIPADMLESRFGAAFKIEEGAVVAYDRNGNKLYSKTQPGAPAAFEEAIEMLVDGYEFKDHILKGDGQRGADAKGGDGQPTSAKNKEMTTADFNKLSPKERAAAMEAGTKLVG